MPNSLEEFAVRALKEIVREKSQLKFWLFKLDKQLAQSYFFFRIKDYDEEIDNPVRALMNRYKKQNKCEYIYQLPKKQFEQLDKEINALTSVFSVTNWHRLYALPNEAYSIQQFWKLYQIITHLDALQFCIENREKNEAPWLVVQRAVDPLN
jgi:hypothetical protein